MQVISAVDSSSGLSGEAARAATFEFTVEGGEVSLPVSELSARWVLSGYSDLNAAKVLEICKSE